MKLLWDTHTFLWLISGSSMLSPTARGLIESQDSENLLSMASIWELAIKHNIGKLSLSQPFTSFIPHQIAINGIEILSIKLDHVSEVATLPLHHKDPFDRLIIAQALVEKISIVSADSLFDLYPVTRLW